MKVIAVIDVTTAGATAPGVTPDPKVINPLALLINRKKAFSEVEKSCKRWVCNVNYYFFSTVK